MTVRFRFRLRSISKRMRDRRKQTHFGLDGLNQKREMLDVPWVGIVRIESLKMRSENDPGTKSCGWNSNDRVRSRTQLHRKTGRAAVSRATGHGTIQIATNSCYRSARIVAPRLLTALRQLQHRAPTFLLMRTSTDGRRQREHCQHNRCKSLSYHVATIVSQPTLCQPAARAAAPFD